MGLDSCEGMSILRSLTSSESDMFLGVVPAELDIEGQVFGGYRHRIAYSIPLSGATASNTSLGFCGVSCCSAKIV